MKAPTQGLALAQHQQCAVTGQNRVRVNVDVGNPVALDAQNVDAVFLADIDVANGLSDPRGRHRYFQFRNLKFVHQVFQNTVRSTKI